MPSARSGYAIVAVLLIASAGAFLRAEQLKLELSPVARPAVAQHFSPTCTVGHQCRPVAQLCFTLRKQQQVDLAIVDASGNVVSELTRSSGEPCAKGQVRALWDGRTTGGDLAPEGTYRLRVKLPQDGRTITIPDPIVLDTTPPVITLQSAPGAVPVRYTAVGHPRVYLTLVAPDGTTHVIRGHRGVVNVPTAIQTAGTTLTLVGTDAAGNRSALVDAGTIS
jgi:hypothetical protein